MEETVTYRRRSHPLGNAALLGTLLVLAGTSIFYLYALLAQAPADGLSGSIAALLAEDPATAAISALMLIGALIAVPLSLRFQREARLILGPQGLRLATPLPATLTRMLPMPDNLRLDEIDRAELAPNPANHALQLVLHGSGKRRWLLAPEQWRPVHSAPEASRPLVRWRRWRLEELQQARRTLPLLRQLEALGVPVEVRESLRATGLEPPGSALEKTPAAVAAIALLAMLGLYALGDGLFLAPYAFAENTPLWPLAGAAAVAFVPMLALLWRSDLKREEALALAVMVAAAAAFAAWPGSMRVNALTHDHGVVERTYILEAGGELRPSDPGLPVLQAPVDRGFWAAQPTGSEWTLHLYRGAIGAWQYDRRPLVDRVREHYRPDLR